MQITPLSRVKKQMTEENFKRIYSKSIEEVITEINPYKFNPSIMEKYVECFYRAIYKFVNFGGLIVPVFYSKFLGGEDNEEFFEWFKREVNAEFFANSVDLR